MRSATKYQIGKDPEYVAWLHDQPCFICARFEQQQTTRTEAAHIGDRGMSQKCPDSEAVPACSTHHREGPYSLHRLGATFWKIWNVDKLAVITHYQKLYRETAI